MSLLLGASAPSSTAHRHADEMAVSGQPLGDGEFVTYVLMGLDEEIYNLLVSSIVVRINPISPSELYSQMLSFELRLETIWWELHCGQRGIPRPRHSLNLRWSSFV
jgi:hypothetical protein